jgi:hypothetical protein
MVMIPTFNEFSLKFPRELGRLEGTLHVMELGHNPLVIPPGPIVNKGTAAILEWLKKNEKEVKFRTLSVVLTLQ